MKMKQSLLIVLCVLLTIFSKTWAQNTIIAVDSLPKDGFILTKNLDFHKGDNFKWKDSTNLKNSKIDSLKTFDKIGWFTVQFTLNSFLEQKPLSFILSGEGAFSLFLDGENIHEDTSVQIYNDEIIASNFKPIKIHTLSVRYFHPNQKGSPDLKIKIESTNETIEKKLSSNSLSLSVLISLFVFFLSIGFVHFMIYLFYKAEISNLYFFIFCILTGMMFFSSYINTIATDLKLIRITSNIYQFSMSFMMLSLLILMYQFFYSKFPKIFIGFVVLSILSFLAYCFNYKNHSLIDIFIISASSLEIIRVVITAIKQKKNGSKIIGSGVLLFIFLILISIGVILVSTMKSTHKNYTINGDGYEGLFFFAIFMFLLSIISIPLSMSIYLAKTFSDTNKNLKQKLIEVENLSAKNLLQEQEKKKILESQKEKLEVQVAERTVELAEKNKDITDSIKYAKRIQEAMLPNLDSMLKHIPDSFVLYKPKDIISGDFYWFTEKNNLLFLAAADCTGHGVPGALMSMIGSTLLNEIINGKGIIKADDILFQLREGIIKSLKQTGADGESKDGMDISLCIVNKANQSLEFAGANNPLWIIRNIETIETESESKLIEIKGNKQPIGIYFGEANPFTAHTIKYNTGDVIYLFTDGYADQFGGPKGKKFKYSQLQQLILNNSSAPMRQQKENLENTIKSWKGELEQIDDILVIGIKL